MNQIFFLEMSKFKFLFKWPSKRGGNIAYINNYDGVLTRCEAKLYFTEEIRTGSFSYS